MITDHLEGESMKLGFDGGIKPEINDYPEENGYLSDSRDGCLENGIFQRLLSM